MNIKHFTAVIKDITERAGVQLQGSVIELTLALSNGDALTGTIETFDMGGLIVVKSDLGPTMYVAADDVVTVYRSDA